MLKIVFFNLHCHDGNINENLHAHLNLHFHIISVFQEVCEPEPEVDMQIWIPQLHNFNQC